MVSGPNRNTGAVGQPAEDLVQVEVYRSFEELASIQEEWDEFLESVGSGIFLTYDWCRVWWRYYGKNRDLRVFLFRKDGRLVGILPMFFERIRLGLVSVRAAKIVGSDYTISHFSPPIQYAYMYPVITRLAEALSAEGGDVICIGPIAGLYDRYPSLVDALKQSMGQSHRLVCSDIGVQTYYRLTGTCEDYLAGLHKKERQLIRNAYNRIEKSRRLALATHLAGPDDVETMFDAFVETHQSHWQRLGRAGHFGDWPSSREFHRELAKVQVEQGRLRLLQIQLSDKCSCYQYSYRFGNRYLSLLSARSDWAETEKIALGKVIFLEQVKNAVREQVHRIDSMQAKYQYKLRLGGELFPMRAIYIIRRGGLILVRVFLFRVLSRLLDLFYFKIWCCRLAFRLPRRRRPLWHIWIRSNAFAK